MASGVLSPAGKLLSELPMPFSGPHHRKSGCQEKMPALFLDVLKGKVQEAGHFLYTVNTPALNPLSK